MASKMYLINADSLVISQAHFAVVSITLKLNCKCGERPEMSLEEGCTATLACATRHKAFNTVRLPRTTAKLKRSFY